MDENDFCFYLTKICACMLLQFKNVALRFYVMVLMINFFGRVAFRMTRDRHLPGK